MVVANDMARVATIETRGHCPDNVGVGRWLVVGVEYKCIMAVFTLSFWIAQVSAISVNSIKGSCPKLVTI